MASSNVGDWMSQRLGSDASVSVYLCNDQLESVVLPDGAEVGLSDETPSR